MIDFYKQIKIPTLVIGNQDDDIVKFRENTSLLVNLEEKEDNPYLEVVNYKKGNHCTQVVSYGWSFEGQIIRDFFVAHSPDLKAKETAWVCRPRFLTSIDLKSL